MEECLEEAFFQSLSSSYTRKVTDKRPYKEGWFSRKSFFVLKSACPGLKAICLAFSFE